MVLSAGMITLSYAAEPETLEATVIMGNNEMPSVLNIMPWRKTENRSGFNSEFPAAENKQAFRPLYREEFLREISTFYALNPKTQQTRDQHPKK